MSIHDKKLARVRRHERIRRNVSGTAVVPRMCVCCTTKHIYVQFVDDTQGKTLVAASSLDKEFRQGKHKANLAGATLLGKTAAERAVAQQIGQVVFDRGGFRYHGRVKAIAEAARLAGLKF